ncbi:MAG TPA: glutamine synthetase family protein [Longimicrobiaceae bacterium]|nr:glutamine synthetase family protein [Longimicrobiaceae bacterium]
MAIEPLFDSVNEISLPEPDRLDGGSVLALLREYGVRLLRLETCDILGAPKAVEVPPALFEAALAGGILFDGSSIDGQIRGEETDMYLRPEPSTLRVFPWGGERARVARLMCDVHKADGMRFEGDPRHVLRRAVDALAARGWEARIGAQIEFFLFEPGGSAPVAADGGGYFGVSPLDRGEVVSRDVLAALLALGVGVSEIHHEMAAGQHEITLLPDAALRAADTLQLVGHVVRTVALRHGLRASFMPKPVFGRNGSGLHVSQSLLEEGRNLFADPDAREGLSETLRYYVGGLLAHARGFCAITNPLVNSYKRLVPGFEAPVNVSWALHNRASLVRVPATRGPETACELRLPDPAANPYLALAVQLAAGLDGIARETDPGDPTNKDLAAMTARERRRLRIPDLPRDLGEALDEMERDRVVRAALGEHVYSAFMASKRAEWEEYRAQVHPWERERYL